MLTNAKSPSNEPSPRIFLEHDVTERNAQAVEETLSVLKKEQDDMPSV